MRKKKEQEKEFAAAARYMRVTSFVEKKCLERMGDDYKLAYDSWRRGAGNERLRDILIEVIKGFLLTGKLGLEDSAMVMLVLHKYMRQEAHQEYVLNKMDDLVDYMRGLLNEGPDDTIRTTPFDAALAGVGESKKRKKGKG